jgi:serine/threonine-protein kinase PpkA
MDSISIPGYRIQKEIGHGGMATVYLAVQESLNRRVALKVMAPALSADRNFSERFLKEARTVAQLSHPNILSIYDIGVSGYHHYIAMEYISGGDLKAKIAQGLSPASALGILKQMAAALCHAHERGFVHRDIKPENILFREDGSCVLTDFGIARAVGSNTRMTGTGMSIGTPHYMSPEQARGKEVDGRSDLYSLGVVFYEMLTGRVPFDADDTFAVGLMHINDPIPDLPAGFDRYQPFIDHLLAKEAEERFSSAQALLANLSQERQGTRISHLPPPGIKPPATRVLQASERSGLKWAVGGAALAIVVGIAVFFFMQQPLPKRAQQGGGSATVGKIAAIQSTSATPPGGISPVNEGVEPVPGPNTEARDVQNDQILDANQTVSPQQLPNPTDKGSVFSVDPSESARDPNEDRLSARRETKSEPSLQPQENPIESPVDVPKAELNKNSSQLSDTARAVEDNPENSIRKGVALTEADQGENAVSVRSKISKILKAAEKDVQKMRLTSPPRENAYERYKQILLLDPENAEAQTGLQAIVDRYVAMAEKEIDKSNFDAARGFLDRASTVLPYVESIARTRSKILNAEADAKIKAEELQKQQDVERLIRDGKQALAKGDQPMAQISFRAALNKSPGNMEARIGMEKANAMANIPRRLKSNPVKVPVNSEPTHSKLLVAEPSVSGKEESSISTSQQNSTTQNQVKIAIFPLLMIGDAFNYRQIVLGSFVSAIGNNPNYQIKYSKYSVGTSFHVKNLSESGLSEKITSAIWKKGTIFSEAKLDEETALRLGKELGIDAIFTAKFHVVGSATRISVKKLHLYLIDINSGRKAFVESKNQSNIYDGQFNAEIVQIIPNLLNEYNEIVTN